MNFSTDMIFAKYGKKEHLNKIMNGSIRFCPLQLYRGIEDKYKDGTADALEGYSIKKADKVSFTNGKVGKILTGRLVLNINLCGVERIPVFCISKYISISEMKNCYKSMAQKIKDTTHVLIIYTPDIFIDDIRTACDDIVSGDVMYGNDKEPEKNVMDIYKQAFVKREQYKYQKEYRFVFREKKIDKPFSIEYINNSTMKLLKIDDIMKEI